MREENQEAAKKPVPLLDDPALDAHHDTVASSMDPMPKAKAKAKPKAKKGTTEEEERGVGYEQN